MKKLIVANWKMNHAFDEADEWLGKFSRYYIANKDKMKNCEAVVCPQAFILDYVDSELMDAGFKKIDEIIKTKKKDISQFSEEELTEIILKERPVKVGAQDCHYESSGSFTGDISAACLAKVGCEYVILGHSERRSGHNESDKLVAKKVNTALAKTLTPVICVGESKEVRDAGKHLDFIKEQVLNSVPKDAEFDKLVIAYEPIWSIGTGLIPSMSEIAQVAQLIQDIFEETYEKNANELFVLYGGSVSEKNSSDILSVHGIDGLLVGKASLDADKFFNICIS